MEPCDHTKISTPLRSWLGFLTQIKQQIQERLKHYQTKYHHDQLGSASSLNDVEQKNDILGLSQVEWDRIREAANQPVIKQDKPSKKPFKGQFFSTPKTRSAAPSDPSTLGIMVMGERPFIRNQLITQLSPVESLLPDYHFKFYNQKFDNGLEEIDTENAAISNLVIILLNLEKNSTVLDREINKNMMSIDLWNHQNNTNLPVLIVGTNTHGNTDKTPVIEAIAKKKNISYIELSEEPSTSINQLLEHLKLKTKPLIEPQSSH